jgi:hypothetical protein
VTANNTFAHILPSGPLDLNEIWLDLRVTDAKGRPIAATPGLDQRHLLSPAAVRLGADLLDKEGQRILDHRFWAAERVINKQILDLDQPRTDAFRFRVPPDAAFPLQAEAAWRYRRYNQNMADAVYGAGRVTFPVVELGSATAQIER